MLYGMSYIRFGKWTASRIYIYTLYILYCEYAICLSLSESLWISLNLNLLRIHIGYIRMNRLWFNGDPIDVLVQTLQQISEKLLGVLLAVTHEPRRESLYLWFQRGRIDLAITVSLPQILYNLAECLYQCALHTRRSCIYVDQVMLVHNVFQ